MIGDVKDQTRHDHRQDGSYLTELLLDKGYEVHGLLRRSSSFNTERIDHVYQDPHDEDRRLILHYADMHEGTRLVKAPRCIKWVGPAWRVDGGKIVSLTA